MGRTNVGIKKGRYMFEVKVMEHLSYAQQGSKGSSGAKHMLRVGFSTEESSLIIGDGGESLYFDSEGFLYAPGAKLADRKKWSATSKSAQRIGKDQVMAVLLNLNSNTVSLFRNGERVSDALPLPESLVGKTLYPHVAYRGVSVQLNFGATPWKPLEFKTTMLQAAAKDDVTIAKAAAPKGGKPEVLFPVGFPGEGTFDWLDIFHEKNPGYTEISDRMILDWAAKSGITNKHTNRNSSRDKSAPSTGVGSIDDMSARKVIYNAASVVPRNYVVMEVKRNLTASDRKELLLKFPACSFKRIAKVAMGSPTAEMSKVVKDKILKLKQAKSDAQFKKAKEDKKRAKQAEQRKKEAAAKAAAKKAAAEKKEEEKKEEEAPKEEEKKEEEPEEESEPPKVELSEEEAKMKFAKHDLPDITDSVLNNFYAEFSVPAKAEGFDEVKFEWDNESKCKDFLRSFILEKKKTARIENIVAGEWFKTQNAEWGKKLKEWQPKQKEPAKTKTLTEDQENAIDVMDCENIEDVGDGVPLYLKFSGEDWVLMALRWELYALATAYKKDVNDEDRTNVPEQHFSFYYNKYFKKSFNKVTFGKGDSLTEIFKLVKDTAAIEGDVLTTPLDAELPSLDIFVRLTENSRRERQRRIDAGDETARLSMKIPGGPTSALISRPTYLDFSRATNVLNSSPFIPCAMTT